MAAKTDNIVDRFVADKAAARYLQLLTMIRVVLLLWMRTLQSQCVCIHKRAVGLDIVDLVELVEMMDRTACIQQQPFSPCTMDELVNNGRQRVLVVKLVELEQLLGRLGHRLVG